MKIIVAYLYNAISNAKELTTMWIHYSMVESKNQYIDWKKRKMKRILYDSIYS